MFALTKTELRDVLVVQAPILSDARGRFVKTFNHDFFSETGLQCRFAEMFHTISAMNVLRGMHLQSPPHHHAKLVGCIDGVVLDVVLDLRLDLPTYGKFVVNELSAEKANLIYVPPGCAHGFLVLSERAVTTYAVTSTHAPTHDIGVRFDSFGFSWPCASPLLSERDKSLPALADFQSPFDRQITSALRD